MLAMPVVPVLAVHVGAGMAGLLAGTVALAVRKGGRLHRRAGNVFFVAMLIMSAFAAWLAFLVSQRGNALGGMFTFYLVATGWATVRRRAGHVGRFEIVALVAALGAAATAVFFGVSAARSPGGLLDGVAPPNYYVVAALAALAAALDLKVILRGGVAGVPRIARHVWRLCVGLFIATGSFFLGQQQVMPAFMQGSLMLFWLFRIRFRNWPGAARRALPAVIPVAEPVS
jgi:uncharacterized membrane protein